MNQVSMRKAKYCSIADEVWLWKLRSEYVRAISYTVIIIGNVKWIVQIDDEWRKEERKQVRKRKAKYCLIADEAWLWKLCSDFASVISCVMIIFGNLAYVV